MSTAVFHSPKVAAAPQVRVTRKGYFRNFVLEDQETIGRIAAAVQEEMCLQNYTATGCRSFHAMEDNKSLAPLLELVVEQAREKISFRMSSATATLNYPTLVVAPPEGSRSNSWSSMPTHRDNVETIEGGVHTFMHCIDESTEDNGALLFWHDTKKLVLHPKNPNQGLPEVQTLIGKKNTVFVWDGRLLHQSLANKTATARKTLVWTISNRPLALATKG
jgi:ectoine hydroxylase-related dioxygenase (phytanoyl-CoA dioxygenase family)